MAAADRQDNVAEGTQKIEMDTINNKHDKFGCGVVERLGSKAGPFKLVVWREGWREGSMRRNYPADAGADKSWYHKSRTQSSDFPYKAAESKSDCSLVQ